MRTGTRIWKSVGSNPVIVMLAGTAIAVSIFGFFYPTHFLIADETVYFDQALTWASGRRLLCQSPPCTGPCVQVLPGDYPAGTALLALPFVLFGGPKAVFWSGLIAWLAGLWGLFAALTHSNQDRIWVAYACCFVPGLALTRTLMSDLHSFAWAALFLWLYLKGERQRFALFGSGIAGGVGWLFRDTNILWALPFLVSAAWRLPSGRWYLWAGFGAGLLPRLVSAWVLYGQPFYLRDPGIGFSLGRLPQQLAFYLPALFILIPGGWYFLWKNNWRYRMEALASVGLFLAVYGCYGYDAFAKSGYKALVVQGRYLAPLLPLLTLCAAHTWREGTIRTWAKGILFALALLLFTAVQYAGWQYNVEQQKFTNLLYALPTQRHLSYSPDESRKYVNPLHGKATVYNAGDFTPEELRCDSIWYLHLITRTESADRESKAKTALNGLRQAFADSLPLPCIDKRLPDGARLRVWEWRNRAFQPAGQHE